jgi:hypothetical protein
MQLAFVRSERRGGTDWILTGTAHRLIALGHTVSGAVQTNT